ncbi:MAG TPA: MGMT family protein [Sulfolobales archaeon]|nr:MGMT family protein [Sulfolobales archaeon]
MSKKRMDRSGRGVRKEILYTLLMLIPPGLVTTYGSLARLAGLSPRVVGRLLAENENVVIIPCHRVVRSDGSLGGYSSGGEKVKKRLLEIEGVRFNGERVDRECIIDLAAMLMQ